MQIEGILKYNSVFRYLLRMLAISSQPQVKQEILFLKVQLEMLRERVPLEKIPTKSDERQVLLDLGLSLGDRAKDLIKIVQYDTYKGWIRKYLDGKPAKNYHNRGRRKLRNVREIVIRIARQTNWGYTRIMGELCKLRLKVSKTTVKNILKENNLPIAKIRKNKTWLDPLKRHFQTLWACDFFTQEILTPFGKQLQYVLFFINMKTRQVLIAGLTKNPTQSWVYNQIKDIIPYLAKNKQSKSILIRDRDNKYPKRINKFLRQNGVSVRILPRRSPNLNACAESFVSRIRDECLNHFTVLGERHLRYLINEYAKYYNTIRPHQGLNNQCPDYTPDKITGELKSQEILGGLQRHYYWE